MYMSIHSGYKAITPCKASCPSVDEQGIFPTSSPQRGSGCLGGGIHKNLEDPQISTSLRGMSTGAYYYPSSIPMKSVMD